MASGKTVVHKHLLKRWRVYPIYALLAEDT